MKPQLTLTKPITIEKLVELYRKLTGKEPTKEEVEKLRKKLAK